MGGEEGRKERKKEREEKREGRVNDSSRKGGRSE